jgi:ABC-type Fe3+/spermidine/putrescine transport system ATPase subunit
MMIKMKLSNVGRDYAGVAAVEDFSLEVGAGEFISLLGPSGCGKTTMLRMIAGFMEPTRGTIEVNGVLISGPSGVVPPEKRGMSMIFQSYAIWPNMTVEQNVSFGLEIRRVPAAEMKRRVDAILEVVHLADLAKRYPAELSGGQQQRVALARAIVVEPEVLLLDEPLSNLDANLREEMRFEIRRMHDEYKITTIYVTHDQSEAMLTSSRIVLMNGGRIEQVDAPTQLYNQPKTRFAASFIGKTNLIAGRVSGSDLDFGSFQIPTRMLKLDASSGGEIAVSLRPQNIRLSSEAQTSKDSEIAVEGRIVDSAYIGGYWDYSVDINIGKPVSVLSDAMPEFSRGQRVWASIKADRIAVISDG